LIKPLAQGPINECLPATPLGFKSVNYIRVEADVDMGFRRRRFGPSSWFKHLSSVAWPIDFGERLGGGPGMFKILVGPLRILFVNKLGIGFVVHPGILFRIKLDLHTN
jgi:hypothetical protein